MKNTYLILLLMLSVFSEVIAQDCPDQLFISNQGHMASFNIDYPSCTNIPGDVTIYGGGSYLTNLDFLENVTSIGGKLHIYDSDSLMNLSGLENLTSIGGKLNISDNTLLVSLSGLDNVTSIGGEVMINRNNALTSLSGLGNVTTLNEGLWVKDNDVLPNLSGLENLTSIGEYFYLEYNDALTSLAGLENLTSITGVLEVYENNALTNLNGLENLNLLDEGNGSGLLVLNNASLTNLGVFENLDSIGAIWVSNNDALINMSGLENLTSLRLLRVYDNDFLTSLEGLNNLISLGGGELQVYDNAVLTNLNGLDNIDPATIAELTLTGSPNLTACEVESICNYLAVPSNLATISGNASGCNTRAEVEAACEVVGTHTINGVEVHIYPNPTTGIVNLEGIAHGQVTVMDNLGRIMIEETFSESAIDLSALSRGMYLLQIRSGNEWIVERIIKE